ncbi:MAG: hypothetical protein KDB26_16355 [Microthrixaceae bacterium]|nr:hypothetical protein [Microthrixaceae bacterium]
MSDGTPLYVDESWITEAVFPAPPTPLRVWQWATSSAAPPGVTARNLPVFAFLTQRKNGAVRVVPSVLDIYGNVRPVEPGQSWRHLTLVVPYEDGNLKKAEEKIYDTWLDTRPKFDPNKIAESAG